MEPTGAYHLLPDSCPALAGAPGLSPGWPPPQSCGSMSFPRAGPKPGDQPQPPEGTVLAVVPALPGLPPLTGDCCSSCFRAGPVARAGASASLGKIPHPMWENPQPSGAFFFPFFRNMSQSGNPVLSSPQHRGAGHDRGMTLDTVLATGLTPLSLRAGPASSLRGDHYTIKPLVPSLPTLSLKEQNRFLAQGPILLPIVVSRVALAQHTASTLDHLL